MPRLNKTFHNTSFFLYGRNPRTGALFGPVGTGVLVAVPLQNAWFVGHTYAVTCHHCILSHGTIIRINTSDGKSRLIETAPEDWQFQTGGSDIAAIDLTDLVRQSGGDEIAVVPTVQFATKEFMQRVEFGIGEDGFMLGLFSDQPGKDRNMVAARFGNVSLLADDREPLEHPHGAVHPSHLFDMHSRPGSSGSPIFAYRTPAGDLRTAQLRGADKEYQRIKTGNLVNRAKSGDRFAEMELRSTRSKEALETEDNTFLVLFGIHVGQYHDTVTAKKLRQARAEGNTPINEGDKLVVPNSVALVAPAWDVYDLIMIDRFVQRRKAREDMNAKRAKPNAALP